MRAFRTHTPCFTRLFRLCLNTPRFLYFCFCGSYMNLSCSALRTLSFSARYQRIQLIGAGGMGKVYTAHDRIRNQIVALKLIHENITTNADVRQCFNREANAFALLRHPNIVEIYDFGLTETGQIYLSTEFVPGCSLTHLLAANLPLSAVLDIAVQLLSALAYAHARSLIHLDLKLENILLILKNNRFYVKLIDFGLAFFPEHLNHTLFPCRENHFGTPEYMSPEQILRNNAYIGPCSDIYGVGVLLYQVLCGNPPFKGKTDLETMRAHVMDPIPPMHWRPIYQKYPAPLLSAIENIIQIALSKSPWNRFLTALEFKDALKNVCLDLTLESLPTHNPIIENLKKRAANAPTNAALTPNERNIGAKIRAVENSEIDRNIDKNSKLPSLKRLNSSSPRQKKQQFDACMKEAAEKFDSDFDFYREILFRTASLGETFSIVEAQTFWQLDADHALSDRWREALAAWAQLGSLIAFTKQGENKSSAQNTNQPPLKVHFLDPDYQKLCLSEFNSRKRRFLTQQAADAIAKICDNTNPDDVKRYLDFRKATGNRALFVTDCIKLVHTALDHAMPDLSLANDIFKQMGAVFDTIHDAPTPSDDDIKNAVDWNQSLTLAAHTALKLGAFDDFDRYLSRLTRWCKISGHANGDNASQCLRALRHLYCGNYARACEIASLASDAYLKQSAEREAASAQLIQADAEIFLGKTLPAKQRYDAIRQTFLSANRPLDAANVNARLSLLNWFSGDIHTALDEINAACAAFQSQPTTADAVFADMVRDFLLFAHTADERYVANLNESVQHSALLENPPMLSRWRALSLVLNALNNDWEKTAQLEIQYRMLAKQPVFAADLNGITSCLEAIKDILCESPRTANDKLISALAFFGPNNRHARAWCHALFGVAACFTQQLNTGLQSFERARTDFVSLDDKFGMDTVLFLQSVLLFSCHQCDEALTSALDAYTNAHTHGFQILISITAAFALQIACELKQTEKIQTMRMPETPCLLPIFHSTFVEMLGNVLDALNDFSDCHDLAQSVQTCLENAYEMRETEGMAIELPIDIDNGLADYATGKEV